MRRAIMMTVALTLCLMDSAKKKNVILNNEKK